MSCLSWGGSSTSKQIDSFHASSGGSAITVPVGGIWGIINGGTGSSTAVGSGSTSTFTPKMVLGTAQVNCVTAGFAVTSSATNLTVTAQCYQRGHFLIIDSKFAWSAIGGSGNVIGSIAGITGSPIIDTSVLPGGTATSPDSALSTLGNCMYFNGNSFNSAWPTYLTTTTFQYAAGTIFLAGSSFNANWALNCHHEIPIVGW